MNGNHILIGVSALKVAQAESKKKFDIMLNGDQKGSLVFNSVKRTVRH